MDYRKAFALLDNPFGLTRPRPGYVDVGLWQTLQKMPLLVDRDHQLLELYCEQAGPFGEHIKTFQEQISLYAYTAEPPSAGMEPFIWLIMGHKGTGKTSLGHFLINHLKKCRPVNGDQWHVFDPWPNRDLSAEEMGTAIKQLRAEILGGDNPRKYCCIVIDNLFAGSEANALWLFDELRDAGRIVFLFMLTSDLSLLQKPFTNSRHDIHKVKTRELTSRDSTAFVRHRISLYRDTTVQISSRFPLYPFDEADLQYTIESGMLRNVENGTSIITLRQLNGILDKALKGKLFEAGGDFNVANLGDDALERTLIRLSKCYEKMVA